MDLTPTEDSGRRGVLDEAIFPAFSNDAGSASVESPAQLQKDDPLGTQIWKLYARAKTQLPNSERMENLSWRLMSLNMRRAEQARNNNMNRGYMPNSPVRLNALCGTRANRRLLCADCRCLRTTAPARASRAAPRCRRRRLPRVRVRVRGPRRGQPPAASPSS